MNIGRGVELGEGGDKQTDRQTSKEKQTDRQTKTEIQTDRQIKRAR